jgi:hypothetical protein
MRCLQQVARSIGYVGLTVTFACAGFLGGSIHSKPATVCCFGDRDRMVLGVGVAGPLHLLKSEATEIASAQDQGVRTFPIVRVSSHIGVPLSTFFDAGLQVDVLISGSSPNGGYCDGTVSATCPYNRGYGVSAINSILWASSALRYYEQQCGSGTVAVKHCPEIEVLNEPGGRWFWGQGNKPQQVALSYPNARAYAILLKETFELFHARYGSNAPALLASFDSGYGTVEWGFNVWANFRGRSHIDVANYVGGITIHPYGGTTGSPGNEPLVTAASEKSGGVPVYVTEVGWSAGCSVESCPCPKGKTAKCFNCTPSSSSNFDGCQTWGTSGAVNRQWTNVQQADNFCNFVNFARRTGEVAQVIAYNYVTSGIVAAHPEWFGLINGDGWSNTATSPKPAWASLERAADGRPCTA